MNKDNEEFKRLEIECKLGIKAFHNLKLSSKSINIFIDLTAKECIDHVFLASLYQASVIFYSKPFTETRFRGGRHNYKINRLKKLPNFSIDLHDHILEIRKKLVAHDDIDEIEPRIMFKYLKHDEELTTLEACITNKAIMYPKDVYFISKMGLHISACENGLRKLVEQDLKSISNIRHVNDGTPRYSKTTPFTLNPDEHLSLSDLRSEEWANIPTPHASQLYLYDEEVISLTFTGKSNSGIVISAKHGYRFKMINYSAIWNVKYKFHINNIDFS